MSKLWLSLTAWSCLIFIIGFAIGDKSANQSQQKVITELQIELTKLKIKKLKGME